MMGSSNLEELRFANELQHEVTISRAFYLGTYEVTVEQFRAFILATRYQTEADTKGKKDAWKEVGWPRNDRHPVLMVSRNDCLAFCRWLSAKEGRLYRLPTEAEWEYACRAGTTTRFHSGDAVESLRLVANIDDLSVKQWDPNWPAKPWNDGYVNTAPVGQFKPNDFGIYDMHGNVYEWCSDYYDPKAYKGGPRVDPTGPASGREGVIRGGCWWGTGVKDPNPRSALRVSVETGYTSGTVGFRVVCTSPVKSR
jgi:formylglycine-generating enzyme required for sulfatase activity